LTFFENDFESIKDYVHELKNRYIESIEDYLYPSEVNSILKKLAADFTNKQKETNDIAHVMDFDAEFTHTDVQIILNPDDRASLSLNEKLGQMKMKNALNYIYENNNT